MGVGRADRRVVVGLPEGTLAAAATERLRQRGWHVWRAATAGELRRLAWRHFPAVAVLPAEGGEESGALTCAKLRRAQPRLRVLLVGADDARRRALARFVGANLVPSDVEPADLVAGLEEAAVAV